MLFSTLKKYISGSAVYLALAIGAISFFVIAENVLVATDAEALESQQAFLENAAEKAVKLQAGLREHEVVLTVDGKQIKTSAVGESVGAVLSREGVIVGPGDSVSPSLSTLVDKSMAIRVVTSKPAIQFLRRTMPDTNETVGESEIVPLSEEPSAARNVVMSRMTKASVPRPSTGKSGSAPIANTGVVGGDGVITLSSGDTLNYSRVLDVQATAYTTEGYSQKRNALGRIARVGTIAVDPRVIPLKSKVYITSRDGTSWFYGVAVCEDTGGAIKGNIIDLYFDTRSECFSFGRRMAKVYILE